MAPSTVTLEDVFNLVGTRLAGRIAVESVVARGGFGLVYRGHHEPTGTAVAVKVLLTFSQYSEAVRAEFSRRFEQESRLIARLTHPATVRLVDHGVDPMPDGELTPWMALEWLDGRALHNVARERGEGERYTVAEALELLRPSIEALAEAHAVGIAHRDITPGNIFVSAHAGEPRSRLIDFGVAREMERDAEAGMGFTATHSTVHAFTMKYAAPEQLSHARTGPWTDVHAMGLVLTQLLTGEAPYPGRDETERTAQVLSAQRPTPGAFGVDVGPLEAVLAKAVALRPADRYPHAAALLEALDAARGALPPTAREAAWSAPATAPSTVYLTSPRAAPEHRDDSAYTSVPSGLMTATTVLPPAAPTAPLAPARALVGVLAASVCVLLLLWSQAVPRSAPLVASLPNAQPPLPASPAPPPVAPLEAIAPMPVVLPAPQTLVLAPPTPATPATPVAHRSPSVRHRPVTASHAASSRAPAAPTAEPQELPRCRSLHERNCRP